MNKRGLTAYQLEKRGGPNHETVTKVLNAQSVTNITLERLARALAYAPDLPPEEVTNRASEILNTLRELCPLEHRPTR
jgi:hypothetical protein